jgi:hypothetical protein
VVYRFDHKSSVANWPKFLQQNAKVAPEKYQRQRKSAVEFYADFRTNGRKGAKLIVKCGFPLQS